MPGGGSFSQSSTGSWSRWVALQGTREIVVCKGFYQQRFPLHYVVKLSYQVRARPVRRFCMSWIVFSSHLLTPASWSILSTHLAEDWLGFPEKYSGMQSLFTATSTTVGLASLLYEILAVIVAPPLPPNVAIARPHPHSVRDRCRSRRRSDPRPSRFRRSFSVSRRFLRSLPILNKLCASDFQNWNR
jgi:hypothetical protein